MKLKTCFADMFMFIVAKTLKIDKLKISKFYKFHFLRFKVLQCMALGASLDNCLRFSFARRVYEYILPTDSIAIVYIRLCRDFNAV